jgi:hypothetical protein
MNEPKQLDLTDYVHDLDEERRKRRRSQRPERRTFIVFATDPEKVGEADYKLTFATEAHSGAEAEGKVREVVDKRRRVTAYLASGKYGPQLPEARWVA